MKPSDTNATQLRALTILLISLTFWSCNDDKTPSESAAVQSAQEQPSPPTISSGMPGTGGGMMDQLRAGCPMVVQGADVTVSDTEGAVALTFTTDTGDVADLRTRVQHMAKMYQMHHGQAGMMWHHMGGKAAKGVGRGGPGMGSKGMGHDGPGTGGEGMGHMSGRGPMPAASATMTNTDLGARLELRPSDASQLDALREHVRWHQQRMHSGECWMLQGQPTTTPPGKQE